MELKDFFILDPRLDLQFRLTLITGPVRSGKTRLALELARSFPPPRLYLATAQALDEEMAVRIKNHRAERGEDFLTVEEPLKISARLRETGKAVTVVVVDCLTLWLSNLLGQGEEKGQEIGDKFQELTETLKGMNTPVILIGNEVGWGIVPENPLARTFRDLSGRLQQEIALMADQVILMVAGIPWPVKGGRR
jgi:adenosylcobinamide kinase/adenosylcobinamide-phosphate guanylyltransferase